MMSGSLPYNYVRWNWLRIYKVQELVEELGQFRISKLNGDLPSDNLSLMTNDIYVLEVKADTLFALLAPSRANLFQRESAPFTSRDLELRRIILTLYPHSHESPLSIASEKEPNFNTVED